ITHRAPSQETIAFMPTPFVRKRSKGEMGVSCPEKSNPRTVRVQARQVVRWQNSCRERWESAEDTCRAGRVHKTHKAGTPEGIPARALALCRAKPWAMGATRLVAAAAGPAAGAAAARAGGGTAQAAVRHRPLHAGTDEHRSVVDPAAAAATA